MRITHTLSRPTELQMLVALVDQAVEKLVRGPTSTTVCVGSLPSKMLTAVSWLGSKVSRSSLRAAAEGGMDGAAQS